MKDLKLHLMHSVRLQKARPALPTANIVLKQDFYRGRRSLEWWRFTSLVTANQSSETKLKPRGHFCATKPLRRCCLSWTWDPLLCGLFFFSTTQIGVGFLQFHIQRECLWVWFLVRALLLARKPFFIRSFHSGLKKKKSTIERSLTVWRQGSVCFCCIRASRRLCMEPKQ